MGYLDNLPENVVVLGDPAYRNLHPAVIHRVLGQNLNDDEERLICNVALMHVHINYLNLNCLKMLIDCFIYKAVCDFITV